MVRCESYRARLRRNLRVSACGVTVLASFGLFVAIHNGIIPAPPTSAPLVAAGNTPATPVIPALVADNTLPSVLSPQDSELYAAIFKAQKLGDWAAANASASQLDNKILMGHVLAERYLSPTYVTRPQELAEWLSHYADHPQAADIYALALNKAPGLKNSLPEIHKQQALEGYGDDIGMAQLGEDTPYAATWREGLNQWRLGHKEQAAKLFSTLTNHQDALSPWMVSAANFWCWRALTATGHADEAQKYLNLAATEPRTFYGIIARHQLKQHLDLDTQPVTLSARDIQALKKDPAAQRTLALAQAGRNDMAEKELRAVFPQADSSGKMRLLALAYKMNLASVQIGMAKQLSRDGQQLDFARYPIPDWQPSGGFTVDPALIFALTRQESGFRASAVSPSGALGLMQLIPQTANMMRRQLTPTHATTTEPEFNLALGQNYVTHLLGNELVDGNLIYLLAAYNAGPARLQEWKGSIGHSDDPLLFVESIPYPQTRYYVMQVMANYWIYAELTGESNTGLQALQNNQWPHSATYVAPVAANVALHPAG